MSITKISSGARYPIEILPIEKSDFKSLRKSRYYFNWEEEVDFEIFKLGIKGQKDILGLISIERIPNEWRIHIRLLTVSKENKGKNKIYENICANLLTFISKLAIIDYGELACISLRPKSKIKQHYIEKYKMTSSGKLLSLVVPEIIDLINLYDNEKQ